ncbi:MAG: hypothetical protein ACP5XB_30450 [Isosphaeraceae bacterium]
MRLSSLITDHPSRSGAYSCIEDGWLTDAADCDSRRATSSYGLGGQLLTARGSRTENYSYDSGGNRDMTGYTTAEKEVTLYASIDSVIA